LLSEAPGPGGGEWFVAGTAMMLSPASGKLKGDFVHNLVIIGFNQG
jgi:hypothetical protein